MNGTRVARAAAAGTVAILALAACAQQPALAKPRPKPRPAPVVFPADLPTYAPTAGLPRGIVLGVGGAAAPGLDDAMAYWNTLAGRTLFAAADGPVTILATAEPCVGADACAKGYGIHGYSPAEPYQTCEVFLNYNALHHWPTIAHELGHCLGFKHLPRGIMHLVEPDPEYDASILARWEGR